MNDANTGNAKGESPLPNGLDPELTARLDEIARTPCLLVASDYDGTMAPIVSDPEKAFPIREAVVAMRVLAGLPCTVGVIISGRALADLAKLTGQPAGVRLVGSHGSEFDAGYADRLTNEQRSLRDKVIEQLNDIASGAQGLTVETKPSGAALHFRNASHDDGEKAKTAALEGPGSLTDVIVKHGKMVVELTVCTTHKGDALERIRHRVGATAALFIGDDITDEDAFKTLRGPDLGIKVGEGETAAQLRIPDTGDAARVLAYVAERRASFLESAACVPIQDHAMLSDMRTIALVTPEARINWLCCPRIDSTPVFADLLGGPGAGYFSVRPVGERRAPQQFYREDSFILETRWPGVTVTDYLDCSQGRPNQRAGRTDLTRVISGTGKAVIEFAPRLDFGRSATTLIPREHGLTVGGHADPIVLRSPGVEWKIIDDGPHHTGVAEVDLSEGPVLLVFRYGTGSAEAALITEAERRRQTDRFWRDWAATLRPCAVAEDLVQRSALILKALCYGPTGAISAAGTTSLPEHIGGIRNWDYRYCWPRDAAMTASALCRLGSSAEGLRLLDWLLGVIDRLGSAEHIAPIYTVNGSDLGVEAEISEMIGYAMSRPVRVGNAAAKQVQLDVFGPVADLVHDLMLAGAPLSSEHWRLVRAMAEAVTHRWQEPDHGIWEPRRPVQHHVHSKAMCWVTLDRAAKISEQLLGEEREDFRKTADKIRDEILEKGWCKDKQAYTAVYAGDEMDAAVLTIGLCGMIDPKDPRFVSTIKAVEKELRVGTAVYRYLYDDGLPGEEGAFNLCTAWLIESCAASGRHDDARSLFNAYCKMAGPTGLLSEEHDPHENIALGNVPQAYTHLGLINAALRLESLRQGKD